MGIADCVLHTNKKMKKTRSHKLARMHSQHLMISVLLPLFLQTEDQVDINIVYEYTSLLHHKLKK